MNGRYMINETVDRLSWLREFVKKS